MAMTIGDGVFNSFPKFARTVENARADFNHLLGSPVEIHVPARAARER
jgi:hypothetical protein